MEQWLIILSFAFPFLGLFFWALFRLIWFIREKKKSHTFLRLVFEVVAVPFYFSAVFLQRRKERQLPLYFQYFLKFTRFCSQVPYFHFFPKFVVATIAELTVTYVTQEPLLTALVFTWSFFFFLIITIVESMYGEFEEEVVTLANKIFLFSVSVMVLFLLFLWMFFRDRIIGVLDNFFFEFMADVAHYFNEQIWNAGVLAWGLPLSVKILIVIMLGLYISGSLYLSKKGIK